MRHITVLCFALSGATLHAAPVTYTIDPGHTFPSFEADHMGISYWRGKFDSSEGRVVLDRAAAKGTVEISVDLASIDFGHDKLDAWARGKEFFDVAKYSRATLRGHFEGFAGGAPTKLVGTLDLHGVKRPLTLSIDRFRCIPHPLNKRELCGANATGSFDRSAFGLAAGKDYGFDMNVTLRIQVEALRDE